MVSFYRSIKQCENSYVAYRDCMMIVLILGTGIRRGEILNGQILISLTIIFLFLVKQEEKKLYQ